MSSNSFCCLLTVTMSAGMACICCLYTYWGQGRPGMHQLPLLQAGVGLMCSCSCQSRHWGCSCHALCCVCTCHWSCRQIDGQLLVPRNKCGVPCLQLPLPAQKPHQPEVVLWRQDPLCELLPVMCFHMCMLASVLLCEDADLTASS